MPLDTSSRFAEAIRALELGRSDAMQRYDQAKADMDTAARDVRDIDEVLETIHAKLTKPGGTSQTAAQPRVADAPGAQTEEGEVKTTRYYIRQFLRRAGSPQTPVAITRALVEAGAFTDYKKAKPIVDVNLRRMKHVNAVERSDEGWFLKDDQQALTAA